MAEWVSKAVLAASAALFIAGGAAVTWSVLHQQPAPPAPHSIGPHEHDRQAATTAPTGEVDAKERTTERITPGSRSRTGNDREHAAPATVMSRSVPVSIDIPAIDVSSPLHALGLNDDGTLQVPSGDRYDEAAWYEGSPTPGEIGPAVIEGHVTSHGSTPSVFFELGALTIGDEIRVTRNDGTVAIFEVYAADSFPKDAFPTKAVYGNTDRPELRLITCGGEYDPEARAHVDNVVVFANLVSTS